jgi:hypothetical protein
MNDEVQTETTDQTETTEPVERQALPELSLSEHEEQFPGGKPRPSEVLEEDNRREETPADKAARELNAADQARDKETGQFKQGKKRGKDAVKRIDQLTGRAKTAEERLAAAEAEIARLRTPAVAVPPGSANGNGHQPAAAPRQEPQATKPGERFQLPAPPFDPEPQENDAKFGGDAFAYLRAIAAWNGRQAVRQSEFDRMVEANERTQKATEEKELSDFATRVDASRERHEDFDAIAFETKTPIPKGSITDTFVMRDDNGPELLYYLHAHPKELDELLKMPELGQVKFLTLLSQRLSSNGNGLTASPTTSVPGARTIVLPPKPPNVVRTEAQRASSGVPMDRELSLSEHEHYFRPTKRR